MRRRLGFASMYLGVLTGALCACLVMLKGTLGVWPRADNFRFEQPWMALLFLGPLVLLFRSFRPGGARWEQRLSTADRSTTDRPRVPFPKAALVAAAPRTWRNRISRVPGALRFSALALGVLALMGPQSVHVAGRTQTQGIDIVVVMDVSLSMQAADIRPNRFVATQVVVQDFVARRPNDRVGVVVFGRDAYTLLPLTTDKQSIGNAIRDLRLGQVDGRGTAIGNAVATGLNRLRQSDAKSRVLILLTDGDSNSGNLSPLQATEFAETLDVQVYPVLMGRSGDSPVQKGTDLFGRPIWDTGNFPINPELLQEMADRTGGSYFEAVDRKGLEDSFHGILNALEKSDIEDGGMLYGELFATFLWIGLVLLLLEVLLRTGLLRRWP